MGEIDPADFFPPRGVTYEDITDGNAVTVRSGDKIVFAFTHHNANAFFLNLQYTATSPTTVTIRFHDKPTVTKKVS